MKIEITSPTYEEGQELYLPLVLTQKNGAELHITEEKGEFVLKLLDRSIKAPGSLKYFSTYRTNGNNMVLAISSAQARGADCRTEFYNR